MKNKLSLLLIFASLINLKAQKKEHYFPIWTFQQSDITIDGISIGLASGIKEIQNTTTNGIKLEIIGVGLLVPLMPMSPIREDDSILNSTIISEKINGLNLSFTGSACDCEINGISAGFVGEILYKVNGVSATFAINIVQIHNGIHLAAIFSENFKIKGLQVAFYNGSKHTKGLQLGVFNSSQDLRGIQIGLWNKNGKRSLPIINWQFKKNKTIES